MSLEVANMILTQLGGRRFIAMTGVMNLVGSEKSLNMKLPGVARCEGRAVSGIRITLDASDTYTIEAYVIRKLEAKTLTKVSDVYEDNLRQAFTRLTGLATSL